MNGTLYVVTDLTDYLNWDDHGAMASGYPHWTTLRRARFYDTFALATKAAEAAWPANKSKTLWVQKLELVLGVSERYVPVEKDPEWDEYKRLKAKFNNR